ncbi:MAG: hydrogenase maturation protease, partial [Methanoregula sp.]|nr:hydrogenase maturation protease [Methanoregula sp.]
DYGAEPGSITKLRVEDLPPGAYRDAHSWDLAEPLQRIKDTVEITIIGVQPARVTAPEFEIGLSEELQRAMPEAIRVILEMIGVDYEFSRQYLQEEERQPGCTAETRGCTEKC